MRKNWLVRPETIRLLWVVFAGVLVLTVLAGVLVDSHGHDPVSGSFAFSAWYGFSACVALIALSKMIGIFLKRPEDYYDE